MTSSTPFSILLLIWLSTALPLCFSESRLFHFRDEGRRIIPLDQFGFTSSGQLNVVLSNFSYSSPHHPQPDLSQVGFFLWPRKSLPHLLRQLGNRKIECPVKWGLPETPPLTFRYLEGGKTTIGMGAVVYEGEYYTLLFANCVHGLKVSVDVQSSMFNFDGSPNFRIRNFLSAGEKPLPRIYLLFFLAYLALIILWTHHLLINKKRHAVFRIHFLILAVLVLKALNLFCEAEKFLYIKLHGNFLVHRFKVAFYLLRSLTESFVFIFTVLVSTNTGYLSFLRPFSSPEKGKMMVFFVIIPLQIIGNIAKVFADESGPVGDYAFTWKTVFLLGDLVCCFAWLIINEWSLKEFLRSQDQVIMINSPKLLEKLKLYFSVVKSYVFLTRVVLFALDSTMIMISHKNLWITMVVSEFATFAFYVFMGFTFLPRQVNKSYHYSLQNIDEKVEKGEAEPVTEKMVKIIA